MMRQEDTDSSMLLRTFSLTQVAAKYNVSRNPEHPRPEHI